MGSLLTNWAYGIYAIEGVLVMFCVFSVLFVVALVGLIYAGYSLTIKNIGVKAGLDGTWRAWIPVVQDVYMLKAARMKLWCLPFFGFTGLLSFATIFFCAWGIPYLTYINNVIYYLNTGLQTWVLASFWYLMLPLGAVWAAMNYIVTRLYLDKLYRGFGFNPVMAWLNAIPYAFVIRAVVGVIIAFKNDIEWNAVSIRAELARLNGEVKGFEGKVRSIVFEQQKEDELRRDRRQDSAASGSGKIKGLTGIYQNASVDLRSGAIVVMGRDPGRCQMIFDEKSCPEISKTHCSIRYDSMTQTYFVTDLNSTNGTFTNSDRRLRPNMPERLPRGAVIYLGSRKNTFQLV